MNASATIRASYVRASIMNTRPVQLSSMPRIQELESRPAHNHKLANFQPVNHLQHREECERERQEAEAPPPYFPDDGQSYPSNSFMDFDDEEASSDFGIRLRKMYTIFPYRDPIYLVAVAFALGSVDLVINAFFDLLPRTIPETSFETEETIAVPTTVLIGSTLFLIAGILDSFGALNADRGTLQTSKDVESTHTRTEYKPALLGSKEWAWIPSRGKFTDLLFGNLAFQAGLIVLFGGIIFMVAGITDFPGVIPEDSTFFGLVVFGPQVVHGFMFLVANGMLAIYEQERWWKPKVLDADWQGAFLNAVGGFGFLMAGFFLFRREDLAAAVAAMGGSWAFLVGSLVRWYAVMDFVASIILCVAT
ncbi:uncharacterized protein BDR25DRAFT_392195 [Lindgomyces ingoldianus]|uniref:Uncharacterized protein n=1 Tax=Lindgomyces ingoldianus TaxID=673940 RepID=A0ACB6R325_9PLEO|nr:uncharacterized protein BDR25DRAFT_392195 [Lindgomyces ingoldianus]KAF2473719.1 hypothetical protein BDR25DRAFT_392195 [Lindgomyces ingoldianus]